MPRAPRRCRGRSRRRRPGRRPRRASTGREGWEPPTPAPRSIRGPRARQSMRLPCALGNATPPERVGLSVRIGSCAYGGRVRAAPAQPAASGSRSPARRRPPARATCSGRRARGRCRRARPCPAPRRAGLLGVLVARLGLAGSSVGTDRRALRPCRGLPARAARKPPCVSRAAAAPPGPGRGRASTARGDRRRAEAVAHAVERRVEGAATVEGSTSWIAPRPRGSPSATPTSVMPWRSIIGIAVAQQRPRGGEDRLGLLRWPRAACASASRARSRRSAGAARPCGTRAARRAAGGARRSTSPTRTASRASGDRCPRPSARCAPIERRRRADLHRAAGRGCARARGACGPAPRPTIATSAVSASRATWPTRRDPALAQLVGGDRADAPQPLDRQRVQEGELAAGRHHEQAVGLGHAAGHLGQELGPRHADRDRQADALEDLAAQAHGDVHRRPGDPAHPADVEERLVDREPLDQRGRVVEDLEHRLARLRVGGHPRRDHRPRAGTAAVPARRPSRCARRAPWPRSWPRARRRHRR